MLKFTISSSNSIDWSAEVITYFCSFILDTGLEFLYEFLTYFEYIPAAYKFLLLADDYIIVRKSFFNFLSLFFASGGL
jgi:hypothetical protein